MVKFDVNFFSLFYKKSFQTRGGGKLMVVKIGHVIFSTFTTTLSEVSAVGGFDEKSRKIKVEA